MAAGHIFRLVLARVESAGLRNGRLVVCGGVGALSEAGFLGRRFLFFHTMSGSGCGAWLMDGVREALRGRWESFGGGRVAVGGRV